MSPLRRQSPLREVWRVLYPIGIHFLISQIVSGLALFMILKHGQTMEAYYNCSILLIGVSGLLTILPVLHFYKKDRVSRIVGGLVGQSGAKSGKVFDYVLLLIMGAAMAQFGNLIVSIIQIFLQSDTYTETFSMIMEGKSLAETIYWMGIVAPVAEEAVFRWLIYARLRDYVRMPAAVLISGLLFGIYHGNLVQFIYATMLGCLFAYFMEMAGNLYAPVLLHIGANIWSLVYSEFGLTLLQSSFVGVLTVINFGLLAVLLAGSQYYTHKGKLRNTRCV